MPLGDVFKNRQVNTPLFGAQQSPSVQSGRFTGFGQDRKRKEEEEKAIDYALRFQDRNFTNVEKVKIRKSLQRKGDNLSLLKLQALKAIEKGDVELTRDAAPAPQQGLLERFASGVTQPLRTLAKPIGIRLAEPELDEMVASGQITPEQRNQIIESELQQGGLSLSDDTGTAARKIFSSAGETAFDIATLGTASQATTLGRVARAASEGAVAGGFRTLQEDDPTISKGVRNVAIGTAFGAGLSGGAAGVGATFRAADRGIKKAATSTGNMLGNPITRATHSKFGQEFRSKVLSGYTPMRDAVETATQRGLLPKDSFTKLKFTLGNTRRAFSLAQERFKRSSNARTALEGLDDETLGTFNKYVASRQELTNIGKLGGRKKVKLSDLVDVEQDLDINQVARVRQGIEAGEPIRPIYVKKNNRGVLEIEDGKHRAAAMRELGQTEAEVIDITGIKSSDTIDALERELSRGGQQFGERYDALVRYNTEEVNELMRDFIGDAKVKAYKEQGNYVKLQRDIDEDMLNVQRKTGKSLLDPQFEQKLKGGKTDVLPPVQTAIEQAQRVEALHWRNESNKITIQALEALGQAKKIPKSRANISNTLEVWDNGKLSLYEVPKNVEAAAKNLNALQLAAWEKVVGAPTRWFKAGTTGLNPAFQIPNVIKDQTGSAILSKNIAATHNPANMVGSFYELTGPKLGKANTDVFQEYLNYNARSTFIDITRNVKDATNVALDVANLERPLRSKVKFAASSPKRIWRKVENAASYSEDLTRFQNFRGEFTKAIKEGVDEETALARATQAARENSVDFFEMGDWMRPLNTILPYLNAGTQGVRATARAFKDRPASTAAKVSVLVQLPTALATMYNLSDPRRAYIYANFVPEYMKEDNMVLVLPSDDGTWEVALLPKPPGFKNFDNPTRRATESMYGFDQQSFLDVVKDVAQGFSPVDLEKPLSSVTPQALRPILEDQFNKDLYTGQDIVPEWMRDKFADDVSQQYFSNTTESSKMIGKALGISPIRVDKFLKSTFGEAFGVVGANLSDQALQAIGITDQVGGRSLSDSITRRFYRSGDVEESTRTALRRIADNEAAKLRARARRQRDAELEKGNINKAIRIIDEFNSAIDNLIQERGFNELSPEAQEIVERMKYSSNSSYLKSRMTELRSS